MSKKAAANTSSAMSNPFVDSDATSEAQKDSTHGNTSFGSSMGLSLPTAPSLPSMSRKLPETPPMMVYLSVCRQKPASSKGEIVICETYAEDAPLVSVEAGRKMMGRKAPPGWDDSVSNEGWRAIKLPVHDLNGCFSFVCVFGKAFDASRAQAAVEKLVVLLMPMLSPQDLDAGAEQASKEVLAAAEQQRFTDPATVLALHRTAEPLLARELAHANSSQQLSRVEDQLNEVRRIMERNVEMILDRQEQLESIEAQTHELERAAGAFRKNTRKLRRFHLMNQVKWGVAVGTMVSAAVAVPILLLATA